MPTRSASFAALVSACALLLACAASAQTSASHADWSVYNGSAEGDHYSSLAQINRDNVAQLKPAWRYDTGDKGNMETSPLIINGVLYAYTATQQVIALNAATGKLKWKFDSGIRGTQPVRGVTYWPGDPAHGRHPRILAGIMQYLYCLDARTGRPIATFGDRGRIDLRKNLRGNYKIQSTVLTTPGILYKDLIIVGGRDPESHPAPPGDIRAFNVLTGHLVWRFRTIPRPGEPGYNTWPRDAWKTTGAANNWAGMALDTQRGIVYVPTGSAVMDFYGGDRVGNDLYADTILALDAATGRLLWHFQGVHHDIWDRDFPSPPALFTLTRNGHQIPALAQTTKQGFLFVFNRVTGKPLFPIHERPFPPSNVPGEVTSPTQPVPDLPEPFARQRLTEDMLTTRTPEAHAWALKTFRTFRSNGQFVPFAVGQQTIVFPGFDGGAEWGGPAIDPRNHVLYVNAQEMANTGGLEPASRSGSPGEQLYQSQCAMCHGVDRAGSPPAFPSLVNVEKRLPQEKIVDNIRHGNGRMPSFPNINGEGLTALLKFLATPVTARPGSEKELAAHQPAPAVHDAAGEAVYQAQCSACHGEHLEGLPPSFPALLGVGNRLTSAQAVQIIHNGKGVMPPAPLLEGKDLTALLHYLGIQDHLKPLGTPPGEDAYTFTGYRKFLDPDGYPAIAPPWGTLNAIDLATGRYLWKIPLGEYPALAKLGMTNTGSENYGGPVVTAGGVLFIGATVYDRKIRAFDSATGKLLWQWTLPFAGMATPATYMVNSRQYVVIVSSGGRDPNSPVGGAYVAFALPSHPVENPAK
ncbi:MAG TPA: c-type cytochrome [Terracidiphilus sp.]|nr:c-type cytochrome [Terracidiphilus sp.]